MAYRLLTAAAVVRPDHRFPLVLGAGAVVKLADTSITTPIPGTNELPITYVDAHGVKRLGWLADTTRMQHTNRVMRFVDGSHEHLASPWDGVRYRFAYVWASSADGYQLPELQRIVRQLGSAVLTSDNALNRFNQELKMSQHTEQETAVVTKKSTKKSAVKKASAKKAAPAKAEKAEKAHGVSALYALLKESGAKQGLRTAKALGSGEAIGKKDLVALREHVNTASAEARAAGNGSLSSRLSACNRSVRRMIRNA